MDIYTPRYILIKDFIVDKINKGELKQGDKIPSENELSQMFNVSRVTSNKAIGELSMMGVVERVKGKGTFVKAQKPEIDDMSHILSKSFKISSEFSESNYHKLVKLEFIKVTSEIAKLLELKENEEVCKVTRIMENSGEPIAIDYSYIPAYLFNGMHPNEIDINNYYIHEYVKLFLNAKPKYLHIHIDAKLPNSFERKTLNAEEKKPLLIWHTSTIDENNKPIACNTTIAKAEKYRPFINFEL